MHHNEKRSFDIKRRIPQVCTATTMAYSTFHVISTALLVGWPMDLQRAAWPIGTHPSLPKAWVKRCIVVLKVQWVLRITGLLWYWCDTGFHNYCIHLDSKKSYGYYETLYVGVGTSVCVSCIACEWPTHCFWIINLIFILFPLLGTTCLNSKKAFQSTDRASPSMSFSLQKTTFWTKPC